VIDTWPIAVIGAMWVSIAATPVIAGWRIGPGFELALGPGAGGVLVPMAGAPGLMVGGGALAGGVVAGEVVGPGDGDGTAPTLGAGLETTTGAC
jgi:hypothetical protein